MVRHIVFRMRGVMLLPSEDPPYAGRLRNVPTAVRSDLMITPRSNCDISKIRLKSDAVCNRLIRWSNRTVAVHLGGHAKKVRFRERLRWSVLIRTGPVHRIKGPKCGYRWSAHLRPRPRTASSPPAARRRSCVSRNWVEGRWSAGLRPPSSSPADVAFPRRAAGGRHSDPKRFTFRPDHLESQNAFDHNELVRRTAPPPTHFALVLQSHFSVWAKPYAVLAGAAKQSRGQRWYRLPLDCFAAPARTG